MPSRSVSGKAWVREGLLPGKRGSGKGWFRERFGIVVGAHRSVVHQSFQDGISIRLVRMILVNVANQGDLFHWRRDLRAHHKHSDSDGDPPETRRDSSLYRSVVEMEERRRW